MEEEERSWLVVSKLDGNEACHVSYIDASLTNSNSVARQQADRMARTFDCRQGRPEILSRMKFDLTELVSGSCTRE